MLRVFGLVAVLVIGVFALPEITSAQGIVQCDGFNVKCDTCQLVVLVNNIIKILFGLVGMIFAIIMMKAGYGLVTSGGNTAALNAAKSMFQNAIIGLIIAMAAWLLVDTIMRTLLKGGTGDIEGWGPWSEVKCLLTAQAERWEGDPASPGTPAPTPLPSGPVTTCTGGACVPIGIPCSNPASCTISADMAPRLQAMHAAAAVAGARVTEAMPPTRTHKSICHTQGTCVDYSKSGGMTAAEVIRVINAAVANSLRPVYEVKTQAEKDALVAAGAPAASIVVLGNWISAPHFSIYGY